ncbi:MAG: (Fe-S)-binding protein, partial [Candidatus Eremiobacteraeota bacterium]|nr:(Fe-S)-binding protein [Candidatus Eremiobacteraeota bacterium]
RISLIKAVSEGRLDLLSPGFVHQMSECLDCRGCEAVCPSGVEYGRLIEGARARIADAQAPARSLRARLLRSFAFGVLFANMGALRAVATLLRVYQRSGLQKVVRALGLLRLFRLTALEASAPEISARFFVPRGQRFDADAPKATAFLHAGCVMHVAFAEVDEATARMLARCGCTVVVPPGQGCCGALAVHAGEDARARELAKANIAAFESSGADYYVVNAAGCGSALKEYGLLLASERRWAARAQAFARSVRDATELIDQLGLPPPTRVRSLTVTYQDACHLANAQRITAPPRRLLAQLPGIRLIEMREPAVCCGSAGIYSLTQPEMSARLQRRKIDNTLATGAEVVATANPGCALQLRSGLRARGSEVRVEHVMTLLDDAYEPARS